MSRIPGVCVCMRNANSYEPMTASRSVSPGVRELLLIKGLHEIELPSMLGRGQRGVDEIPIRDSAAAARTTDRGALVSRGQEGVVPIARSAVAEGRADRDESGQILVLGPQAIDHPGTYRGPNECNRTRMQKQRGRPVSDAFGA